jgi:hypothetical protein
MDQTILQAHQQGLIPAKPEAAADATGLSADGRSSYYAQRLTRAKGRQKRRKTKRYRLDKWPKINALVHTHSHLILAATITEGPSHDAPELPGLLEQVQARVHLDRLLADAGYDAEKHHRVAREQLHIRATVIALNRRTNGRRCPKTKYRRQMHEHFPTRKFGQRWQAESVWSRHKRKLGWVIKAQSVPAQEYECQNRVLTHNLMLLAAT